MEDDEIAKQAAKAKQLYGLKKKKGSAKKEAEKEVSSLHRDSILEHTLGKRRHPQRGK